MKYKLIIIAAIVVLGLARFVGDLTMQNVDNPMLLMLGGLLYMLLFVASLLALPMLCLAGFCVLKIFTWLRTK